MSRDTRLAYMPAVDGLRAIAVLAVFFYHVGVEWLPGGFLGVDVFFVISGFLITALLLKEFEQRGHIEIVAFWLRRARRLLPAVTVMIAVVLLVALVLVPGRIGALRGDALASLLYVNNWHLIVTDQSYFEQFSEPSLFRHLWSLAVEEQFYLLWPLLCAVGLARLGRRRLLGLVAAGVLASTLLMAILFDPGGDLARVFYGTDTRAAALLVGVALALLWEPIPFRESRAFGRTLELLGIVALVMVVRDFFVLADFEPRLYEGGFLGLALWTGLLVAACAHPATRFGRVVGASSMSWLIWLGLRSYSFYLWHWPVIILTRPNIDVPLDGPVLIALQLLASLALADLSYRYVEEPFRRRGRSEEAPSVVKPGMARPALIGTALLATFVLAWGAIASSEEGPSAAIPAADTEPAPARAGGATPLPERERSAEAGPSPGRGSSRPTVLAIGDSVMLGAAPALSGALEGEVLVDATVARQPSEYPGVIAAYRDAGKLGEHVVVQIGNNGPAYYGDLVGIREQLEGVDHVYLINVEVPRSWESQVNDEIEVALESWPEAELIDWHGVLADNPGETTDGIHPTSTGLELYVETIRRAVRG